MIRGKIDVDVKSTKQEYLMFKIPLSGKGWLIYADGELCGMGFSLPSGCCHIGRYEGDIQLSGDIEVSKKEHCVIINDEADNTFSVKPRKFNLVKINGRRIWKSTLLKNGDTVQIGKTYFIFMNRETFRCECRKEEIVCLYGCPNANMIEFPDLFDRKEIEIIDLN